MVIILPNKSQVRCSVFVIKAGLTLLLILKRAKIDAHYLPPVITLSNKRKIDAWHHIFITKGGMSTNPQICELK